MAAAEARADEAEARLEAERASLLRHLRRVRAQAKEDALGGDEVKTAVAKARAEGSAEARLAGEESARAAAEAARAAEVARGLARAGLLEVGAHLPCNLLFKK